MRLPTDGRCGSVVNICLFDGEDVQYQVQEQGSWPFTQYQVTSI